MANPRRVYFCAEDGGNSGVDITYIKSRNVLRIGGWYDGCVGIENEEVSLGDFLMRLGITWAACGKALREP